MSEPPPKAEEVKASERKTSITYEEDLGSFPIFSVILFTLIFVFSGLALYFEPSLLNRLKLLAGISTPPVQTQGSAPGSQPDDARFAALYQRYEMLPLKTSLTQQSLVADALTQLSQAPCDRGALHRAIVAIGPSSRDAANMLKGWGKICPDGILATAHAAEIFHGLGDFERAIELSTAVLQERPDNHVVFYLRARAYQATKRYEESLNDFVAVFTIFTDLKPVPSEVFMRMSSVYEALDLPCEAMTPIRNYIAVEPGKRMNSVLKARLTDLEVKGKCPPSTESKAKVFVPRRADGMIVATVSVNGVPGDFVIDTGATYVTVTKRHAAKLHLKTDRAPRVRVQTASGLTSAQLVSAARVSLGSVSALSVETVVLDKDFSMDVDGLLGLSFLSRFSQVTLSSRGIEISTAR